MLHFKRGANMTGHEVLFDKCANSKLFCKLDDKNESEEILQAIFLKWAGVNFVLTKMQLPISNLQRNVHS